MRTTIILLFTILFGVQLNAKNAIDNANIPTMETGGQWVAHPDCLR